MFELTDVGRAHADARARWPTLSVSAEQLVASLGALTIEPAWMETRGSELVLAHAAASGDPVAVSAFERDVLGPARAVVRRYAREDARTDEIMQQLRIHLLVADGDTAPRLARFDGRAPLVAWVNMCAVRVALHALRSERTRREVALEWSEALAALPAADPLVEQLRMRHAARVTEAMRTACLDLPRRHRAVLRLLFVDGASVDEVAAIYAVHRVTVWRWVQEARTSMSTQVREQLRRGAAEDPAEASLVAWAMDQVELSLAGALSSTLTEHGK
ncbi:MAG TPA: sigma-70 family RNA polymerase sigma factor [Kofleriaceae bacterium]|nr:sigma-70 family RNA polymerase sigma factor [Kofleriaceae bacterium]